MVYHLSLDDPLWRRLDDAHRDRHIPDVLVSLARAWSEAEADSLFWDRLCHQETLYGATYAVVPHLLDMAMMSENASARRQIAGFLSVVAVNALQNVVNDAGALPGLPDAAEIWDRNLDLWRRLASSSAKNSAETKLVTRAQAIVEQGPVGADDLLKIQMIRKAFLDSRKVIAEICTQAYQETEEIAEGHDLLAGVAAALGSTSLASLLLSGNSGQLSCSICGETYEYLGFETQIALYSQSGGDTARTAAEVAADAAVLDYRDGKPSRQIAFLSPVTDKSILTSGERELLELALERPKRSDEVLLRNFLGTFDCPACGTASRPRPLQSTQDMRDEG